MVDMKQYRNLGSKAEIFKSVKTRNCQTEKMSNPRGQTSKGLNVELQSPNTRVSGFLVKTRVKCNLFTNTCRFLGLSAILWHRQKSSNSNKQANHKPRTITTSDHENKPGRTKDIQPITNQSSIF